MASTLKPSGFANVSVFNTHTISSRWYLYPQKLNLTTVINTHTVAFGAVVLLPSIVGSTQLIHQASVGATYQLSAALYQSSSQINQSALVAIKQVIAPLYQSANQINSSAVASYIQLSAPIYQVINQIEQPAFAAINQVTAPLSQSSNQIDSSAITTVNQLLALQVNNTQIFYAASSAFELLPETINTSVDFKEISVSAEYQLQPITVQNVSEFSSTSFNTSTTIEPSHYQNGNEFYTVGAEAINSVTTPILPSSENIQSIILTVISAGRNLLVDYNSPTNVFYQCSVSYGILLDKFNNTNTYVRHLLFDDALDAISSNISKIIVVSSEHMCTQLIASKLGNKF